MNNKFNARLDLVPENPGVYLMKDTEGSIIYVGKAINLKKRLRSYFSASEKPSYRISLMVDKIDNFDFVICDNELEALILESGLIKRYQPFYNILLKDDKDYPYILIDLSKPAITKVHRKSNNHLREQYYFGPYLKSNLNNLLTGVKEIFQLNSCNKFIDDTKARPCFNYHIGKCIGTCCGKVSLSEYKIRLIKLIDFLNANDQKLLRELKNEMDEASSLLNFEKAILLRNQIDAITKSREKQRITPYFKRNTDVLSCAVDVGSELACIQKLEIRNQRILGTNTYFLEGSGDYQEIMSNFLLREYIGKLTDNSLTDDFDIHKNQDLCIDISLGEVERALLNQLGRFYKIYFPRKGQKYDCIQIAKATATEALKRKLLLSGMSVSTDKTPALTLLQKYCKLLKIPVFIEAYDISHMADSAYCCAMTVFKYGKACKSLYRQFNLELEHPDDYYALNQALDRRFAKWNDRSFASKADLILVDGGLGQLNAVKKVRNKYKITVALAAMVKNNKHKTKGLILENGDFINLQALMEEDRASFEEISLYRFLTTVQNTTHNQAVKAQSTIRKNNSFRYFLEDIKGVGKNRRDVLLQKFDSLEDIAHSTIAELKIKTNFPNSICKNIFNHFQSIKERKHM